METDDLYDENGNSYPVMDMMVMRPGVKVFCDDRDSPYWDCTGIIVAARPLNDREWEFDVVFDGVQPRKPAAMRDEQMWPDPDEERNAPPPPNALKVFICHGKEDKERAREIYQRLREAHFDP
jgi:hypothetical protein